MRKEYNDRWNAPLVNPGFTIEEYELQRIKDRLSREVKQAEIDTLNREYARDLERMEHASQR